jgi:predicted small lipoprotein YifL
MRRLAVPVLASVLLAACGLKGDLFLPAPQRDEAAAEPADEKRQDEDQTRPPPTAPPQ